MGVKCSKKADAMRVSPHGIFFYLNFGGDGSTPVMPTSLSNLASMLTTVASRQDAIATESTRQLL